MQVLGIRHRFDKAYPKVIRYLSHQNWKGKTVAIEDYAGEAFTLTSREYWNEVKKIIQKRGGKVVLVENEKLMKMQARMQERYEKTVLEKYRRKERMLNLERTIFMARSARKANAELLIMGVAHAFDVQKIVGKKSNVKIIAHPNKLIRYTYYLCTLNEMKQKQPRRMKQIKQTLTRWVGG